MRKLFFSGIVALAIGSMYTSCSKDNDLYDSNAVNDQKAAERQAKYQEAFVQAFGPIAVGNDWGFGATRVTRGSATGGYTQYDLSGLSKPINGKKDKEAFISAFNSNTGFTVVTNLSEIPYDNFILQLVIKQTGNGKGGSGTNDQHHQMDSLVAYNFNISAYEGVDHFHGGQITGNIFGGDNHQGSELMVNMGTPVAGQPLFKWIAKKNSNNGEGYECTNYIIKKDGNGNYYVGFGYKNKGDNSVSGNDNQYDACILRLVKTHGTPGYKEFGRVMCEDLGSLTTSDLDFNDVVFDAYIMNDGSINITVLAAGGMLRPVTIGGVPVNLLQMSNTGYKNITDDWQTFTISAATAKEKGWNSIKDIPVIVNPTDGDPYELAAYPDGSAPAKICVNICVDWAKEQIKLDEAYPNWKKNVNSTNPADWYNDCNLSRVCDMFFPGDED